MTPANFSIASTVGGRTRRKLNRSPVVTYMPRAYNRITGTSLRELRMKYGIFFANAGPFAEPEAFAHLVTTAVTPLGSCCPRNDD